MICFTGLAFINEKEFGFSPSPFTFVLCIGPFTAILLFSLLLLLPLPHKFIDLRKR